MERTLAIIATLSLVVLSSATAESQKLRITVWNLEYFPNGSPKDATPDQQERRIQAAAAILKPLNSDILLLQEVQNFDACARLAEAIQPNTYKVAICSAFKGKQQETILSKIDAQAAWAETWKSMQGIDPPRGFAFAYFKVGNAEIGVYSLHLKSNLIMRGNKETETAKNIRKRELAVLQLLDHINNFLGPTIPSIKRFVIGGDFNTNQDQPMFSAEKTLDSLTDNGYRNVFEGIPFAQRITHPKGHGYPAATFDYIFGKNVHPGKPTIIKTNVSDHLPVTCDVEF